MLKGETFDNEAEVIDKLNPISVTSLFDKVRKDVNEYYGV